MTFYDAERHKKIKDLQKAIHKMELEADELQEEYRKATTFLTYDEREEVLGHFEQEADDNGDPSAMIDLQMNTFYYEVGLTYYTDRELLWEFASRRQFNLGKMQTTEIWKKVIGNNVVAVMVLGEMIAANKKGDGNDDL